MRRRPMRAPAPLTTGRGGDAERAPRSGSLASGDVNDIDMTSSARPVSATAQRLAVADLAGARSQITLTSGTPADAASADTLVLAAATTGDGARLLTDGPAAAVIDADAVNALLPALGFSGELDGVLRVPANGLTALPVATLTVVGVGAALEEADDEARDAAALGDDRAGVLHRAAARAARALAGTSRALVALPVSGKADLAAVAHGMASGAYAWSAKRPEPKQPLAEAFLLTEEGSEEEVRAVLDEASALAGALRLARDLVNEPPNRLIPETFAEVATAAGLGEGLDVEVLDETALADQGFGGILGVGQGSPHPPRLVRVTWAPEGAQRRVSLIGKGITFDSGGLSLKPAASMLGMKSDMAGAATVLATVVAAARFGLPVRVDGWLALAENLPAADAQRPNDVVTMYGGRSVEIVNTDAEGRLVMADALARAAEDAPDAILDVATLTGAQLVALGPRVAGVMGTPRLRDLVLAAGGRANEALWPMPLPEHLRSTLDTPSASMRNSNMGSRWGGMLTAGLFLREFVGDLPWAHLDVAGPAFNDGAAWGGTPQGGTGFGVRTLVELLRDLAAGRAPLR